MLKKVTFLILLALSAAHGYAQFSPKSQLSLNAGPSFPQGKFASKNFSDEQSGLAKTGYFASLDYRYEVVPNFGFTVDLRAGVNKMDSQQVDQIFLMYSSVVSMDFKGGSWKQYSGLGGVYYEIPFGYDEEFALEFRALAGWQQTRSPEMELTVNIPQLTGFQYAQEALSRGAFAYLAGVNFHYGFGNGFGVKAGASYRNSAAKFSTTDFRDVGLTTNEITIQQPTATVDVGIGLSLRF